MLLCTSGSDVYFFQDIYSRVHLCGFNFYCNAVHFTWLVVLLVHFLVPFMWYSWFSLLVFSCSLAGIFNVSGAFPVNCGSDKTGLGHFCYKALLGRAPCHQMAQQPVSPAVLNGARWTHCKRLQTS